MKEFLEQIKELVVSGDIRISEHGYDELSDDDILISDALNGITDSVTVEFIRNIKKGNVYYFCRKMEVANPFMYFGVFPLNTISLLCSLLRTGPTLNFGIRISLNARRIHEEKEKIRAFRQLCC